MAGSRTKVGNMQYEPETSQKGKMCPPTPPPPPGQRKEGMSKGHRSWSMPSSQKQETVSKKINSLALHYNPKYKRVMSPCWCKWRDDQQGVGAQTSCTENLQIIYTNILFLKEVEHNFPSFKLGLCLVTCFQRPKYRKGGSKKWPGKHDLHQLTEVKRLTQ